MNAHSAFQVATPFDSVAESYDTSFTDSFVGKTQRNLVWREMDQIFRPGQRILEINCGTGVDAVHLAQRGVRVVACDASSAMIRVARQRAADTGLGGSIEFHIMATEKIYRLYQASPFDALLCIFGRHCLWELIWNIGRGDFEKAFRRFRTAPIRGSIGGQQVDIRYWSVGQLKRALLPDFHLKSQIGLGISVPPSYLESWTGRFPTIFRAAAKIDRSICSFPVFRSLADHVLLTFQRS